MTAWPPYFTQDLPFTPLSAGQRTDFATVLPPGGRVVGYVRSTGPADYDDQNIVQRMFTSINTALSQCRSGRNDIVYVLPGHTESISAADGWSNLVAGTQIIGIGAGNSRPTITWTAAASSILLDVANVGLHNLILNMDPGSGTVTVADPMTISAAGCAITSCQIRMGTDANSKCGNGIVTTAAADNLTIAGCQIYGATAAEIPAMLNFIGADRLQLVGCTVVGATANATTQGIVRFVTTASTEVQLRNLTVRNNKAASEIAILGMAGLSGEADNLLMIVLSNAAGALTTTAFTTPASMVFGRNVAAANTIAERAALYGTESA